MTTQTLTFEEQIAREVRETPKEYWPNLLQLIRLFRNSVMLKPADASFRQGWQDLSIHISSGLSGTWQAAHLGAAR